MRLKQLLVSGCVSAAMAVLPAASATAAMHECVIGKPTAASYTWNFRQEANNIFEDIQSDVSQVRYHAAQLQSFEFHPYLSWQSHADQLFKVRSAVNDMGDRLCRLETIRRTVAPWQQRTIDRIATTVRLIADNTQDAIWYGNNNHRILWSSATYQKYVNNIYNEARKLTKSVGDAVEYAKVGPQYRELRKGIEMKASS